MAHIKNRIHNWLRKERRTAGLTLKEASWILGHRGTCLLYQWEHGYSLPSTTHLLELALLYGCLVEHLYEDYRSSLKTRIYTRKEKVMDKKREHLHDPI